MKTRSKIVGAALGVLFAVTTYMGVACGCVALIDGVRGRVRAELQHVAEAEQRYFVSHRRYARALTEVSYAPDSTLRFRVHIASDSSIRIGATSTLPMVVSCSVAVRPAIRTFDELPCTR